MKKLRFQVNINASKNKVWDVLWNDATYPDWTNVFSNGSKAVSDWQEGSEVLFLAGSDGMFSVIDKSIPDNYMSFKHLGVIKNGEKVAQDEETKKWAGAMETYSLTMSEGVTTLAVEVDITEDVINYMNDTFPKALDKIKMLSEQ